MNIALKQYFKLLKGATAFWSFALVCYAIFRYLGLEEDLQMRGVSISTPPLEFGTLLFIFLIVGGILGIIYSTIEFFFEQKLSKKLSLGLALVLENVIAFCSTIVLATIVQIIISDIFDFKLNVQSGWWVKDHSFWSLIVYIGLASFVYSLLKIASERFGPGVFYKILLGKYRNPLEEKRIFMFLDLKGSTPIAEKLGHFKYSQLLQDCFYDLNSIVLKYNAEIYQYVGDEAVLSWSYEKGVTNNNCLHLFFAFQNKLLSKKDYYMKTYGLLPEFKSGLHGGKLMAAEIGFVKKELAYHGDVINTAARIQAECNVHQVNLLLSESLIKDLRIGKQMSSKVIGDILLKGKRQSIKIYSLSTNKA